MRGRKKAKIDEVHRSGNEKKKDVDHTPELLADLQAFWTSKCEHSETRLCRTRITGGSVQVREECPECGKLVGSAKPQGKETINLPWSNPEIGKAYEAKRKTIHSNILKKHLLLQSKKNSDWWKAYNVYLASPEWAAKRQKVLNRAGGICEGCGRESFSFEIHHTSYANLFDEFLFQLVALCPRCHGRAHPKEEFDEEDDYDELPCCGCRFQFEEFGTNWCSKFNIPARAALSLDGRCGPSAKALEPLR